MRSCTDARALWRAPDLQIQNRLASLFFRSSEQQATCSWFICMGECCTLQALHCHRAQLIMHSLVAASSSLQREACGRRRMIWWARARGRGKHRSAWPHKAPWKATSRWAQCLALASVCVRGPVTALWRRGPARSPPPLPIWAGSRGGHEGDASRLWQVTTRETLAASTLNRSGWVACLLDLMGTAWCHLLAQMGWRWWWWGWPALLPFWQAGNFLSYLARIVFMRFFFCSKGSIVWWATIVHVMDWLARVFTSHICACVSSSERFLHVLHEFDY
jgi:hypothetical protein